MTDTSSTLPVPEPRPSSEPPDPREVALRELAARAIPKTPPGVVGRLVDQVLVHTSWDAGRNLIADLPDGVGGIVLRGTKNGTGTRALAKARFPGEVVLDSEAHAAAAATVEAPFVLPSDGGLFGLSLDQVLDSQRQAGATVGLTPTGYLRAGDGDPLKAAADVVAKLDRDDFLLGLPLDVAWFNNDNIGLLIAVLKRLDVPKAVFLGGQFDPMDKYKSGVLNLRRLLAEGGDIAVLRTDLTAFDAMTHGAFAASIGTGGSLRHIIPYGERAFSANKDDQSPSVLYGDLMTFFKGKTLAERFANDPPPTCSDCGGRPLDEFTKRSDRTAAHAHGLHTWGGWVDEMKAHTSLAARASWWKDRCAAAVAQCDIVNSQINQEGAFEAPAPLKAWADLPAWLSTTSPAPRRSRTP